MACIRDRMQALQILLGIGDNGRGGISENQGYQHHCGDGTESSEEPAAAGFGMFTDQDQEADGQA